ncbi:MAG: hypothetical protein LBR73_02200 [Oscillospiraceae bacterium]|jgi:hypothetical protein|nr:hypothetical protein [Oscillospiraceae bacterium]
MKRICASIIAVALAAALLLLFAACGEEENTGADVTNIPITPILYVAASEGQKVEMKRFSFSDDNASIDTKNLTPWNYFWREEHTVTVPAGTPIDLVLPQESVAKSITFSIQTEEDENSSVAVPKYTGEAAYGVNAPATPGSYIVSAQVSLKADHFNGIYAFRLTVV